MHLQSLKLAHNLFLLSLELLLRERIGIVELVQQAHALHLPVQIFEVFVVVLVYLLLGIRVLVLCSGLRSFFLWVFFIIMFKCRMGNRLEF